MGDVECNVWMGDVECIVVIVTIEKDVMSKHDWFKNIILYEWYLKCFRCLIFSEHTFSITSVFNIVTHFRRRNFKHIFTTTKKIIEICKQFCKVVNRAISPFLMNYDKQEKWKSYITLIKTSKKPKKLNT